MPRGEQGSAQPRSNSFIELVPATGGSNLLMRMGTGGGPTYDTGSNDHIAAVGTSSAGSAFGGNISSGTALGIAINLASAAAYGNCSFSIRLFNPQGANNKNIVGTSVWHNGTTLGGVPVGGLWAQTTAMTAFQFPMSSGNLASGVIRVYGIAK